MAKADVLRILTAADALLSEEKRWLKGDSVRFVHEETGSYLAFCLRGAINEASLKLRYVGHPAWGDTMDAVEEAISKVARVVPLSAMIPHFNDDPATNFPMIKAVLKMAMEAQRGDEPAGG